MNPSTIQMIGAGLFAVALIHTFSTKHFERLAHTRPAHAGLWHFLGEVEVVFGFWAMVMMFAMFAVDGKQQAVEYLDTRNFTEPLFVFAIMVAAASKPILQLAGAIVRLLVKLLPLPKGLAFTLVVLSVVPLLGSFITEPAAMTLAALLMRDGLYAHRISTRLKYAALGVLFVNISIGGTLTPYAAPPVLMVATAWGWDLGFMLQHFGWKAALAVGINAAGLVLLFNRELRGLPGLPASKDAQPPLLVTLIHLTFLAGIVVFAHHPAVFLSMFMFFLGFTAAYERYQSPLILREGLLVAFFLAGLVVLGGQQRRRVLRCDRLDGHHRQRRPHLPGLARAGFERRLQVRAGGWRGDGRGLDHHRQRAQPGRCVHPQGGIQRSVHRRWRPADGRACAHARGPAGVQAALTGACPHEKGPQVAGLLVAATLAP